MALKRRLILHISTLIAGLLLLGLTAILGVSSLHQDFSLALRANEQLRQTYTIGQHVASARSALTAPATAQLAPVDLSRAVTQFEIASRIPWLPGTEPQAATVATTLQHARDQLSRTSDPSVLDPCYAALADLSAATRRAIESRQAVATRKHHLTLLTVTVLAATLTLSATVAATRLYRAVMTPLRSLRQTTQQFASNRLTLRASTHADEEFASLARDFNHMAAELQSLYADLEQRVDTKSRQLARSERLASVGYLAAGVAHEINNPLAIIAGFAQRSLQRLSRTPLTDQTVTQLQKALQTISDESFRCKEITTRLLELSRPGPAARTTSSLAALAADVCSSVGGLPRFANRRLSTDLPPDPATTIVHANEGELRQVLLNLLINALEATDPNTGHIHLSLTRTPLPSADWLELSVTDNGKGIPPDALPRLFEPFYAVDNSAKPRDSAPGRPQDPQDTTPANRPGTGLGLSIAHAIATDHAGTLDARSPGVGLGATFTLRLPAYAPSLNAEPTHA